MYFASHIHWRIVRLAIIFLLVPAARACPDDRVCEDITTTISHPEQISWVDVQKTVVNCWAHWTCCAPLVKDIDPVCYVVKTVKEKRVTPPWSEVQHSLHCLEPAKVIEKFDSFHAGLAEIEMRALPSDIRKGVEHLGAEAKREVSKYPLLATILETSLRLNPATRGLAVEIDQVLKRTCVPTADLEYLHDYPQLELDRGSRDSAKYSTPFKRLGAMGWIVTGCYATGEGVLKRDAAQSTDGFCTVDVSLTELRINGTIAPTGRYLRLELEPGTPARKVCDDGIKQFAHIIFSGPVLIDTDSFPPSWSPFLEVHPLDDFRVSGTGTLPAGTAQAQIAWPMRYKVRSGDNLSVLAEKVYKRQNWPKLYNANRRWIHDPNLIYPPQEISFPDPGVQSSSVPEGLHKSGTQASPANH
jgi:hypothetical protein